MELVRVYADNSKFPRLKSLGLIEATAMMAGHGRYDAIS